MDQDQAANGQASEPQAHDADQSAAMMQKLIAPAISMGLTWAARKAMTSLYEKRTGQEPPSASDQNVPIGKVLVWAAVTAVVSTAIDTIVNRTVSKNLPADPSEPQSATVAEPKSAANAKADSVPKAATESKADSAS